MFNLFGRLDFEYSYKQQLCELVQSGAASVAAFASRTTELSTRAYFDFLTNLGLDLAVDYFISSLRDASFLDNLRRKRARRRISLQKAVQMAQSSKLPLTAEYNSPAAATSLDAMSAVTYNFAHSTTSFPNICAMFALTYPGNFSNSRCRNNLKK